MAKKPVKSVPDYDVVIIGGGHAGCTMAALLGQNGLRVACLDRDSRESVLDALFDGRTTAISYASMQILEKAGVWKALSPLACPILDIRITENDSPVLLDFPLDEAGAPAFGWVVENRDFRRVLFDHLKAIKTVDHIAPARAVSFETGDDRVTASLEDGTTLTAPLMIGADGRQSSVRAWMGIETRGWSYKQKAVVCMIEHENPHKNVAWENFRGSGPLAILPVNDDAKGRHRSTLVWTEEAQAKTSIAGWDENIFNAALNERIPDHYGAARAAGPRFSYPLSLSHAHRYVAKRTALIADAAHGIHPIAGQGLNLGFRDIYVLGNLLTDAHKSGDDLGSDVLLKRYEDLRYKDNMMMAAATDALNKIFSNDSRSLGLARKIGLRLIQRMPATRKFFMRHAMGTGGDWKKIAK